MEKENLMNTKEVCEDLGVSRIWLKEKIRKYKELAFATDLTDDEKALRGELRIELKNASSDLAKELKEEFNEIERKRKELND